MLPGDQLAARLARLGRLAAAPLPVVELLPVRLLAAPQHRHGAPRLLHHLHDAVQRLRGRTSFQFFCLPTKAALGFLAGGTRGAVPGRWKVHAEDWALSAVLQREQGPSRQLRWVPYPHTECR